MRFCSEIYEIRDKFFQTNFDVYMIKYKLKSFLKNLA